MRRFAVLQFAAVVAIMATCIGVACNFFMSAMPAKNMPSIAFTTPAPRIATVPGSSDPTGDEWPMFHRSLNRTGVIESLSGQVTKQMWVYMTGFRVTSSPAIAGGRVYVGSEDQKIYCFNATSGSLIWSYNTNGWVDSSPAITGGRVFVGSDDHNIYCLNASTGSLIWIYSTGDGVKSSPAVTDGLVYVGNNNGHIYCLNATTGISIWCSHIDDCVSSSPAIASGLVYVIGINNYDWCANLFCLNATTGLKLWAHCVGMDSDCSPAVNAGLVYSDGSDGILYCQNATTGSIIWSYATSTSIYSSPAVSNGCLFACNLDGNIYCLNSTTGRLIWNYDTGHGIESSPAILGSLLCVGGCNYKFYCLNATTGACIETFAPDSSIHSSAAIAYGRIYFGSDDYRIYCLPLSMPSSSPQNFQALDGNTKVMLSWNVPGGNGGSAITNYIIYRGTSSNNEAYYDTISNVTSFIDMNVTNNQTYYYEISAVTANGEGPRALEVSAFPSAVPHAPYNVQAIVNCGKVLLSWQFPPSNGRAAITNYKIYKGVSPGTEQFQTKIGNMTTFYDTNVTDGQKYYYKVSAQNGAGEGFISKEVYVLLYGSDQVGDNWPMFRGSLNHTGTFVTSPAQGNISSWTFMTGGGVKSSPSVVDGRVYVGSNDHKIYCLNATMGALLWSYTTSATVDSSPAVIEGRVFVGDEYGYFYCLNATTGNLIWRVDIGDGFSSPAIIGGYVYVGCYNGVLACINATTGAYLWCKYTNANIYSSPAIAGGRVYVGDTGGCLSCFNVTTGVLLWKYQIYGMFYGGWGSEHMEYGDIHSSPAVANGLVYVGNENYNPYSNSPFAYGYQVPFSSFYCLNATTGAFVWSYNMYNDADSSSAIAGGRIYMGNNNDNLYCLNATTGKLIWQYGTGSAISSSPAIAGGRVYVGSNDGKLYCLNATTGCCLGTFVTGSSVDSSPAIAYGRVYVGSEDGKVYCLPMNFPPSAPQNLRASGRNAQVTLTWQVPVTNGGSPITSYKIYRGTSTASESFLTSVNNVLFYMDTNVTNGLAYYYTISAVNANGEGLRSNEVQAIPSAVPPAPLNLRASNGSGLVMLTWQAPPCNGRAPIVNYKIYRGTSMGNETLYMIIGNLTSYTDTSVLNAQPYHYKVSAVNGAGEGALSNEARSSNVEDFNNWANGQSIAGETSCEHVHWVTASCYGDSTFQGSSMVISSGNSGRIYDASSSDWVYACAEYDTPSPQTPSSTNQYWQAIDVEITANSLGQICMSQVLGYPGSSATVVVSFAANGSITVCTPSNWIGTGLTWSLNTKYTLVMQCLSASMSRFSIDGGNTWTQAFPNVNNWTGPVKELCMYTGAAATCAAYVDNIGASWAQGVVPSAPQSLSLTRGNGQVVLNWSVPASNGSLPIMGYRIFRGTTSGSETLFATIGNVFNYTVTGLTNGQVYYFKVQAVNDVGMGVNSTEASATPATMPTAPLSLTAAPLNTQSMLTWIEPSSNGGSAITNYRIYQGNESDGEILLATIGNVTTYTATGLTNDQIYYFKVAAVNAMGSGVNSTETNAMPATVPTVPQALSAIVCNGQVMLTWTAPASNGYSAIIGYRIYRGTTSNGETLLATIGAVLIYTSTGLTNGQVYFFQVSAVNDIGEGPRSTEANATPATVPTSPQAISAMAGYGNVMLAWTAPANNGGLPETNYCIFRGTTPNGEFLLVTIGNVTTFTSTGLTNGQIYYFKVAAINAIGTGANSTEACATPTTLPTAPQAFTAVPGNMQVMLSWAVPASSGSSAITGYNVYSGITSNVERLLTTTGNMTAYTSTELANGQVYYFKVAAINAVGTGVNATEVSTMPVGPPANPQTLTATPGNGQVILNWATPASNGGSAISGYDVYRGTTSGGEALLTRLGVVLAYTDTGLTNGQVYYYQVSALNAAGEGARSTEANAMPRTVPGSPSITSATAENTQVILAWSAPASNGGLAITGYNVYRGIRSGGETLLATLGMMLTYTSTGLTSGQIYYFTVAAVNAMGTGANSTEASATPATVPTAPRFFMSTAGNDQVLLSWAAPASNGGSVITNYWIYQGNESNGEILIATRGNMTTYTATGLTYGQVYYFKVAAVNPMGEGANSTETTATPATLPTRPRGLSAMASNGHVMLTWTAPESNGGSTILGYRVFRGTTPNGETLIATVGAVQIYTSNDLTNGQVYYFKIAAVNTQGTGVNSTEVSATPAAIVKYSSNPISDEFIILCIVSLYSLIMLVGVIVVITRRIRFKASKGIDSIGSDNGQQSSSRSTNRNGKNVPSHLSDKRFCGGCGLQIKLEWKARFCPNCGENLQSQLIVSA